MRVAACKPSAKRQPSELTNLRNEFRKVGENLYRYSSNDRYYGVFRVNGKLIWKSLKTSDRELAKRKLKEAKEKQGKVDPSATKLTLSELLDLYGKSLPGSGLFWFLPLHAIPPSNLAHFFSPKA